MASEVSRFEVATLAAANELAAISDRVAKQVGEVEAAIFRSHQLLARDPALIANVSNRILNEKMDASSALHATLNDYAKLFEQIRDEYIRERLADIRDVVGRVIAHLTVQEPSAVINPTDPVIIVAPEILPSQAVMFERMKVVGIITEKGAATGHAAILARSLGIPAVSGIPKLLLEVQTGELVVVDGREGIVHVRPGPEVEAAYRKLQREYFHLRNKLGQNRDLEPITKDGCRIDLLANVNGLTDARLAAEFGTQGVGLYRTEFLFLTHTSVPTEEEQLAAYQSVIQAAPHHEVTIRTLDLGGDKQVNYLGEANEANPFMGWRSIRLTTAYPEFFQAQIKAILRAAREGKVELLFPMVSTIEEVRHLRQLVEDARTALRNAGTAFAANVPFGIMVEVPSAAFCIDSLLEEVDFVSIGSNDLLQYLMAADRDNPRVAHLCDPFTPAIYKLLNHIIQSCLRHGKPVTLCGEMAGRPRCVLPLLGMGLRRFSMSPGMVASVKETIRATDLATAKSIADRVLTMRTVQEIKAFLTDEVRRIAPDVAVFDSVE